MDLFYWFYILSPVPLLTLGFITSFRLMSRIIDCKNLTYCCCQKRLLTLIFGFSFLGVLFILLYYYPIGVGVHDYLNSFNWKTFGWIVYNTLFFYLWYQFNTFVDTNFLQILEMLNSEKEQKQEAHKDMEKLARKYINDIKDCRYGACSAK